jgi:ribonuclease BN (tRNA processing enzyme)
VRSDTTAIVLDLGPGTLLELRKHIDYRILNGIVVSHLHVDHMLDLIALRFALSYNPDPAPARIRLFMPPGGVEMLDRAATAFDTPGSDLDWFGSVYDIHEYDPYASIEIGDLTCTFHPTVHWVPCWAIRVHPDGDDGDLLYTADTGPAADLAGFGQGASVVLAEAADRSDNPSPLKDRGHLSPTEAGKLAADIGAHTLILTHIWEERGHADVMREAQAAYSGSLLRATPSLECTWKS